MEKELRLKIISDGTPQGTIVSDEDGNRVENVSNVEISIGANMLSTVRLTLVGIPVEVSYKANDVVYLAETPEIIEEYL